MGDLSQEDTGGCDRKKFNKGGCLLGLFVLGAEHTYVPTGSWVIIRDEQDLAVIQQRK